MRLQFTEDEQAIHEAFAAFFAKECTTEAVRKAAPLGFCRDLWQKLCETGAPGMALPESCGGGGADLRELGIVAGLAGSSIAPVPLVEHAVASRLLARLAEAGTDLTPLTDRTAHLQKTADKDTATASESLLADLADDTASGSTPPSPSPASGSLLADLADGSAIATLALRPLDSSKTISPVSEAEALDLSASSRETTTASDPTARLLPAGAVANVFLALCDGDLLAISSPPPLVNLPNTADLPVANREIPIASSEVATLASGPDANAHFRRAVSEWQALTAVAICGLGQRALQIGVEYALERHQFDRPIGSFQAVQHGLADAATELEAAYYLCQRSLWMLDAEDAPDFQRLPSHPHENSPNDSPAASSEQIQTEAAAPDAQTFAAMAFLFTSEAAQRAAAASLHYHGGYGYAEEYDIGLYYRRAKGWSLIYDSPAREYQRLADILLGTKTAV